MEISYSVQKLLSAHAVLEYSGNILHMAHQIFVEV